VLPVSLHPDCPLVAVQDRAEGVRVLTAGGDGLEGAALVGADGLWSLVRGSVVADGVPVPSDHVAYRALIPMDRLPTAWQAQEVAAWLGPHLHAVTYPVRGGALVNLVCVVRQPLEGPRSGWDLPGTAQRLRAALGDVCPLLQQAIEAAPGWGLWVLHDRAPVAGANQMARGRIALLGDAAHPMRPYLAQGASMALEDAQALGRSLAAVTDGTLAVEIALQRYARERWQRVARVQRRSLRNATIFHATGPLRFARDRVMGALGPRVMDLPWLYAH
jgi:salicylate hydroxylase